MENLTKPNTTILLNKNKYGIVMTRKNFKRKSVISIKGASDFLIARSRFDNIEVLYKTKYMNWQNYDHCGGWASSSEDLVNQFMKDKKLFADLRINARNEEYESVKSKVKECESMENVIVCYHELTDDILDVTLIKKGCVADYIDVKKVLESYAKFEIYLDDEEFDEFMALAHHSMVNFANRGLNEFKFDFINPNSSAQYIFNGMLLGYPIESTLAKKEYR